MTQLRIKPSLSSNFDGSVAERV